MKSFGKLQRLLTVSDILSISLFWAAVRFVNVVCLVGPGEGVIVVVLPSYYEFLYIHFQYLTIN